jgi:hypothetical protein
MQRRAFLERLSLLTGTIVLMPAVQACGGTQASPQPTSMPSASLAPPVRVPEQDWDALTYNRERGNAGAIPESYLADVNGPEGDANAVGKHLPFVPEVDPAVVPAGFLAIMWGDPSKGHAAHPNAVRSEANNNEGHWYNWIRIRKAVDSDAEELESGYSEWPGTLPNDTGAYAVLGGGDINENSGKNTIYLAALPAGVQSGDTVRVWAHCLTHGEYVDFLTVP